MSPTPLANVNTFAEVASGFCEWCEGQFLGTEPEAAAWLCQLYAAALSLPKVEPENSEGLPTLPQADVARAQNNLSCFNGRYYREYFDPDPTLDDEPVMGDIGDDLLDTYKDIKAGCVLFAKGQIAEALWQWSFLHRTHWGRHTVGALFALHCLSISSREWP